MITITCNGCAQRIAEDDEHAGRNLPIGGERVDWCGDCIGIIRAELPRLVSQAREARRAVAAMPVHQRARNLWQRGDTLGALVRGPATWPGPGTKI